MDTLIVVFALGALAYSEMLFARWRLADAAEAEPELDDADGAQDAEQPDGDYSDLTPAEIRQRAKSRLGPRAW